MFGRQMNDQNLKKNINDYKFNLNYEYYCIHIKPKHFKT